MYNANIHNWYRRVPALTKSVFWKDFAVQRNKGHWKTTLPYDIFLAWNFILLLDESFKLKNLPKTFCYKAIVLCEGSKSLLRTWHYSLCIIIYYIHIFISTISLLQLAFLRFISLHPLSVYSWIVVVCLDLQRVQ